MFKFIRNTWNRFTESLSNIGKGQTLSKVIDESDVQDHIEIKQANAVIVNHQYIRHMAEARIAARSAWRALQEATANGQNVTPFLATEQARSRKL